MTQPLDPAILDRAEPRGGDARPRSGLARRLIARFLDRLRVGRLTVVTPGGEQVSAAGRPGPEAVLVLHRWRALRRLLVGGDVAFGRAYVDRDWSSPDLTALLELAAANEGALREAVSGFLPTRLLNRLHHGRRANTRRGSRWNILAHYDLGNAFYARWLDPGMNYSSGLYRHGDESLERAQELKLDRLVAALQLRGGERILEIGCGWGGLAERLGTLGYHVTGLTLSPAQFAHARERIARAGLAGRVELRLQDYRDVAGSYDRIVSVEMVEAVGRRYWPTYFATLHDRLAPGGLAVLQAITIADARFPHYAAAPDFIQRCVFPGGMLPSPAILAAQSAAAGLGFETVECFGPSYARTLQEWRARFGQTWMAIEDKRFDNNFHRLWDYYLAYCEAAFRTGATDVGIYALHRAGLVGSQ